MDIPGYEILGQIGKGTMGSLWRAQQALLGRVVALRMLPPELTADPDELQAFLDEARAAARLKHPNLLQSYDVSAQAGNVFIAMEYVEGPTVARILEQSGALSVKEAMRIAECVALVLGHAWNEEKLTHRDIRPGNIMLDQDRIVKLADLGMTKRSDPLFLSAQLQTGVITAITHYLSPEQAQCTIQVDFRTDMYGLGATLYHMVTGVMPFNGCSPMETLTSHVEGTLVNPRDIDPAIPIGVAQLIGRLMMKDPKQRYESWADVLADMKKAAAGKPIPSGKAGLAGSTLAAAKSSGSGPRVEIQSKPKGGKARIPPRRTSAAAPAAETTAAPKPKGLPGPISVLIWAGIALWLIYIAGSMLKLPSRDAFDTPKRPPKPPVAAPNPDDGFRAETVAVPDGPPPAEVVDTTDTPPVAPPHTSGSVPDQPPSTTPPPAAGTTVPDAPPATANPPAAVGPLTALDPFKNDLAKLIVAGNYDKASEMLEAKIGSVESSIAHGDLERIREILVEVPKMDRYVEQALSSHMGQEIILKSSGKPLRITISHIINGVVHGTVKPEPGSNAQPRKVTFSVKQMDPVMRSALLGRAYSPSRASMKFLLHLKAGDSESARELAGKCGPMAKAFGALAKAAADDFQVE